MVAVTYILTPDNALRLDYRATTDRPTVVNLTNHSYFDLAGSGTILGQRLRLAAGRLAVQDDRKLPTGALADVTGRSSTCAAPSCLASDFDHNFVLDRSAARLPVVAEAEDPASGRTLEVRTAEPGLQLHTADSFDGSLAGKDGPLLHHAGFALETQHFPDSPNQPAFPTTVLRPGETFRSTTINRFGILQMKSAIVISP